MCPLRPPRVLCASTVKLFCLCAVLLGAGGCGQAPQRSAAHPLAVENALYKLEVPLARSGQLYSVADLANRVVRIKNRGAVLREFPVLGVEMHRRWPQTAARLTLDRKGIAPKPKQTVIVPVKKSPGQGEAETDAVVVERVEDSLELDDMPAAYSLEFEDGSRILVLAESPAAPRRANISARWQFGFVRFFFRTPAATIRLAPDDARALYWALRPGHPALVGF